MQRNEQKPIRVGIDFDGVLAYNPLRIVRAPMSLVQRTFISRKKKEFYIPRSAIEKFFFRLPHELSIIPGFGAHKLVDLTKSGIIEPYLISGRFAYLDPGLQSWIKRNGYDKVFKNIYTNKNDEQPHIFKKRHIETLGLAYFIEDNLDIVEYISQESTTNMLWIYNIVDRYHWYPNKFSSIGEALDYIKQQSLVRKS